MCKFEAAKRLRRLKRRIRLKMYSIITPIIKRPWLREKTKRPNKNHLCGPLKKSGAMIRAHAVQERNLNSATGSLVELYFILRVLYRANLSSWFITFI